jgi:hypothetical protein
MRVPPIFAEQQEYFLLFYSINCSTGARSAQCGPMRSVPLRSSSDATSPACQLRFHNLFLEQPHATSARSSSGDEYCVLSPTGGTCLAWLRSYANCKGVLPCADFRIRSCLPVPRQRPNMQRAVAQLTTPGEDCGRPLGSQREHANVRPVRACQRAVSEGAPAISMRRTHAQSSVPATSLTSRMFSM